MSPRRRKWEVSSGNPEIETDLVRSLGISGPVARVLVNRGITNVKAAGAFLSPDIANLHDPFDVPDMAAAVSRLVRAVGAGERIRVYGDYDVDGITGVSLLVTVLRAAGALVDYYIPNRLDEGYGLNIEAVERAGADSVSLLLTVDCGIGAVAEVERARDLGVDVIVTDHHEPGRALPRCVGVLDPKRKDSCYPFSELAGVGVAFKLCQALWGAIGRPAGAADPLNHLDLVALGTIADVVPLLDENRVIAKCGLEAMHGSENPGISCLLDVSGLTGQELSSGHVGFSLAPRINACGRLGDPSLGAELFLTDSPDRARQLAESLDEENRRRQGIEEDILREALEPVKKMNPASVRAIVLESDTWHTGVIGIVASKIAELTFRPTVLIAIENGTGKGSGRSIPGFNLHSALTECSDLLIKYGGHAQAAGLSIRQEDVPRFRERLNQIGHEWLADQDLIPTVRVDSELREDQITVGLASELETLEPFGLGNPNPLFLTRNLFILQHRTVGADGRHLKLKLGRGDRVLDAIGFRMGERYSRLVSCSGQVDAVYALEVNRWNGRQAAELNLRDLRESGRA